MYNDIRYTGTVGGGRPTATATSTDLGAMIVSFRDAGTRDIFEGADTRAARRTCPRLLWPAAVRKLTILHEATGPLDLRAPPGNRLERLQGDRLGAYSIRLNDQYRIVFRWDAGGASQVEIVDYH